MGNPTNWAEIPHIKVKRRGPSRENKNPTGYRARPAAQHGRALGTLHEGARFRPIWELLAHQGNFIGYQGGGYKTGE